MEYKLRFEVRDCFGFFIYPIEHISPLIDKLNDLLYAHQSGKITDRCYLLELNLLIKNNPDIIYFHTDLAFFYLEKDKPIKALNVALNGLARCNILIPEGFSGLIEWKYIENRPYLNLLQLAILALISLRRHKDSVILLDKLLAYNPNDNHGCRYILGSELLRAGDKDRAKKVFDIYADTYPPYYYELALFFIEKECWIKAATILRYGFSSNIYIAEILCGNHSPTSLAIWHKNKLAEPDAAISYIKMYGELWFYNRNSIAFIRWLFNHSSIMAERTVLMKLNEDIFNETNIKIRKCIINYQQKLINKIDDKISETIIKKIQDKKGKAIWPWMLDIPL